MGLRSLFADPIHAALVMTGLWSGFLYYEWVHYKVHLSASTWGFLGRQRRQHFMHHFAEPNRRFGVTSPLWDFVFGTSP